METSGDGEKDCFALLAKSSLRKKQKGSGVSFLKKAKLKNGLCEARSASLSRPSGKQSPSTLQRDCFCFRPALPLDPLKGRSACQCTGKGLWGGNIKNQTSYIGYRISDIKWMFWAKALFGWAHHCPHHMNVVAIDFSSIQKQCRFHVPYPGRLRPGLLM